MSSSTSLTSGVAGRYATALFELAKEDSSLDKLDANLQSLQDAIAASGELREMISSPILTRADQEHAIVAIASKMDLDPTLSNTLGLMAQNRRLYFVPRMISQLQGLIAEDKGEVTAEVTSAVTMTEEQKQTLAEKIKNTIGSDIKLNAKVDESLIGGLVVKVGSMMVDTSIRSKLANLQNVMKEVG